MERWRKSSRSIGRAAPAAGTFDGGVESPEEIDRKVSAVVEARQALDELGARHPLEALVLAVQVGIQQEQGARQDVHAVLINEK